MLMLLDALPTSPNVAYVACAPDADDVGSLLRGRGVRQRHRVRHRKLDSSRFEVEAPIECDQQDETKGT